MDTQVVLSEDELKVMKEFIEIDSKAKSLDKKKKELSSKVKDIMGIKQDYDIHHKDLLPENNK